MCACVCMCVYGEFRLHKKVCIMEYLWALGKVAFVRFGFFHPHRDCFLKEERKLGLVALNTEREREKERREGRGKRGEK